LTISFIDCKVSLNIQAMFVTIASGGYL